jgi:hypothetical protein
MVFICSGLFSFFHEYDLGVLNLYVEEGRMITRERVLELLDYYPESGFFVWKVTRGRAKVGYVAGKIQTSGNRTNYRYIAITIYGVEYAAHRIAVLIMTGEFPPRDVQIDHRDRSSFNNKWENLKRTTNIENQWNRGPNKKNKLGLKGVVRRGKNYRASITIASKRFHLGTYISPELAAAAYRRAEGARNASEMFSVN